MKKHRTGGMTAVGVLNTVFGGFGILAGLFCLLTAHAVMSRTLVTQDQSVVMLKVLGLGLFGLAVGIVGLIAGIGIFLMARWSRVLNLVFAGVWILNSILSFAFPVQQSTSGANTAGEVFGRLLGLFLGLIYPIILLVLFNKPAWKTAFADEPTA